MVAKAAEFAAEFHDGHPVVMQVAVLVGDNEELPEVLHFLVELGQNAKRRWVKVVADDDGCDEPFLCLAVEFLHFLQEFAF